MQACLSVQLFDNANYCCEYNKLDSLSLGCFNQKRFLDKSNQLRLVILNPRSSNYRSGLGGHSEITSFKKGDVGRHFCDAMYEGFSITPSFVKQRGRGIVTFIMLCMNAQVLCD